jgi:hypothetical protein
MKSFFSALLVLAASSVPSLAITVSTPVNGAQVTSPFNLIASSTTCGGVSTVSMGYSIDSGSTTIEPTSFSAKLSASAGSHLLHVKCWGKQTSGHTDLNITVSGTSTSSNITVASPVNGSKITSPFNLAASVTTCSGVPATSMGYSIDGSGTTVEPLSFGASISKNLGTHTVVVKCYGANASAQVSLSVDIVSPPSAATPKFSVASGTYTSAQTVNISDATAGASIYYTTNGSSPTTSSPLYTGAIPISSSTVIEALALAPGCTNSGLARASYTITMPSKASIPSDAIAVTQIQALSGWRTKYDPRTNGTASGTKSLASDPSLSGQSGKFDTTYSNYGGVLYSVTYGHDDVPTNFVYDVEVWIEAGSEIGNLEMDNNQVISNGDTMIYSFQCSGNANAWEFGENSGTVSNSSAKWVKSSAPCNPANWATNTWHHVQISYTRDDSGNATYHSVWLDGVETAINATVPAEFSLGWATGDLIANFQVDGNSGSGSSILYADNLTLYRW